VTRRKDKSEMEYLRNEGGGVVGTIYFRFHAVADQATKPFAFPHGTNARADAPVSRLD
jgi:hypothetical protein